MPAKKNGKVSPAKKLKLAEKDVAAIDKAVDRNAKERVRLSAKRDKASAKLMKLRGRASQSA